MRKEKVDKLLEKYYNGETSLAEEAELRQAVEADATRLGDERLLFDFFKKEAGAPEGLEEKLFTGIKTHQTKLRRGPWLKYTSVAAAVCLFFSAYWFSEKNKTRRLTEEQQFAVLEQALMQVASEVNPQEKPDGLILFQDENLEIVIE